MQLKLTAHDLFELGICDEIVPRAPGGAHRGPTVTGAAIQKAFSRHLAELRTLTLKNDCSSVREVPRDSVATKRPTMMKMHRHHSMLRRSAKDWLTISSFHGWPDTLPLVRRFESQERATLRWLRESCRGPRGALQGRPFPGYRRHRPVASSRWSCRGFSKARPYPRFLRRLRHRSGSHDFEAA